MASCLHLNGMLISGPHAIVLLQLKHQKISYQCMKNFMYPYSDVVLIQPYCKLIWTEVYGSCNRPEERVLICSYIGYLQ